MYKKLSNLHYLTNLEDEITQGHLACNFGDQIYFIWKYVITAPSKPGVGSLRLQSLLVMAPEPALAIDRRKLHSAPTAIRAPPLSEINALLR